MVTFFSKSMFRKASTFFLALFFVYVSIVFPSDVSTPSVYAAEDAGGNASGGGSGGGGASTDNAGIDSKGNLDSGAFGINAEGQVVDADGSVVGSTQDKTAGEYGTLDYVTIVEAVMNMVKEGLVTMEQATQGLMDLLGPTPDDITDAINGGFFDGFLETIGYGRDSRSGPASPQTSGSPSAPSAPDPAPSSPQAVRDGGVSVAGRWPGSAAEGAARSGRDASAVSRIFNIMETSTYTLSCVGSDGVTRAVSATVNVR